MKNKLIIRTAYYHVRYTPIIDIRVLLLCTQLQNKQPCKNAIFNLFSNKKWITSRKFGSMQELQVGHRDHPVKSICHTSKDNAVFSVAYYHLQWATARVHFSPNTTLTQLLFLRLYSLWAIDTMVWANWTISRHLSYWGWSCKAFNCWDQWV